METQVNWHLQRRQELKSASVTASLKFPSGPISRNQNHVNPLAKVVAGLWIYTRCFEDACNHTEKRLGGNVLRAIVEKTLFYRDGTKTFFDAETFPWVAGIESEWKSIRKELDALMVHRETIPNFQNVSKAKRTLTEGDQWKTFFFYSFGHENKKNCELCSETVWLLNLIPGMKTGIFSILSPRKHILPHRGACKEPMATISCIMIVPSNFPQQANC
jgi:hypothetical protein